MLKRDWLAIGLILIFSFLFFLRLFYPVPSFFVTPDFGLSDIWHFNLPLKFFLSRSLENNQIPLWSDMIANGFPVLAESQIGAFNFINLLFFKFLPFVYAFNLSYVFIFAFTATGTFLYLRQIKINRLVSLFGAISFAFSGYFISQISHINLIQASSFLPWLFLFTERIFEKDSFADYFFFSIFLSQQIFSGFPQTSFINLLMVFLYLFFHLYFKRQTSWKRLFKLLFFVLIGFGLSAIQLLPQIEFLKFSTRQGGLPLSFNLQYSFSLKNLLMFLNPRALGSPEFGSYPDLAKSNFAIFWENNGFVGFLPVIATFCGIFFIKKHSLLKIYFLILLVSFLLMLGKYSPLYVINLFPPFSYFRVPSRFILSFVWSMIIISAIVLNQLSGHKILKIFIFFLMLSSFFHLFSFTLTYNPIKPASTVLAPVLTELYLKNLSDDKTNRFFLIDNGEIWNQVFLNKGWLEFEPYFYFRNNLKANFNIIYNLPSFDFYAAYATRRLNALHGLTDNGIKINGKTVEIEESSLRLLSLSNVKYLLSPYEIATPSSLIKVFETKESLQDFPSYKIYQNPQVLDRAYFVESTVVAKTLEDFVQYLVDEKFDIKKTAIIEKETIKTPGAGGTGKITWLKNTNQEIVLQTQNSQPEMLILTDSYYPGWKAFIDNKETIIQPVNLNFRGIMVEQGSHKIKFIYQPKSFFWGKLISLVTFFVLILIGVYSFFLSPKKSLKDIWQMVPVDYYQKGVRKNIFQKLWHFQKLKTVFELMEDNSYRRILDVGCASGWFLSQIAKKYPNANYTGIDIYKEAIDHGNVRYKTLNLICIDSHHLPFKDNSFNLIICTEVLEHVVSPEKVLKEIKRVLAPGGVAIIEMDSGNFLFRCVWFFWTCFQGKVWRDSHLHSFNTLKLEKLIKNSGLKIIEKKGFNWTMATAFKTV